MMKELKTMMIEIPLRGWLGLMLIVLAARAPEILRAIGELLR